MKESENYGLKILENPDRILRKDVDRTFNTEPHRQLLISLLASLKTAFFDYQQTMSYVSGILLLFFEPKIVFEMMFVLGRHPRYNMSGYWRAEAVEQGIDAYVLFAIINKINPALHDHLMEKGVLPDTFIQKWFGGLAVQVMPTEHLLTFWTQYFHHGFRYLFKFAASLLQTLSPLLLRTHADYQLYEILRVERKTQFWNVVKGADQCATDQERVSLFFVKVLSDANSIGEKLNIRDIDFTKEREHAFSKYLKERFLNAATKVTWQGFLNEEDGAEDDNEDCQMCGDGFGDWWCDTCEMYLCDECRENPTGDCALNHAFKEITINVD